MSTFPELAVLIIEDSESDAALVMHELESKGGKIRSLRIETAKELREALAQEWDIILSDFRLPQFNAIAALEIVQTVDKDIPFIIVSQAMGEGIAVELMRAGAVDYVMKSSLKRLAPAVEREVREARIRQQARTDAAALANSEKNFRLLAENAADMISRHRKDGTYTYVSPAFTRILGYEPYELLGHSPYEFFHPDDVPAIQRSHESVAAAAAETRVEYRLRKKDGDHIWAQSISRSLADQNTGEVIKIQVSTRDITQERLAKAELESSEERYRTLTTELQVGVLIQGPASEILLGNRRAYELLGLTEDQLLGRTSIDPTWNVIHEDGTDFPGPTHPVPTAIATRRDVRGVVMGVYRPVLKDRVWLLVDANPVSNVDGSVRQVICTFSDITGRKQAELAVAENQARFRNIIELSPVPYALNDVDRNITYLNPAFIDTFGYQLADIPTLGDWWPLAYPDADYRNYVLAEWQKRIQAAQASGGVFEPMELNMRCKNGTQKTVLVSAGRLSDTFDGVHLVILYDITERKSAEMQIKAQEAFLHSVIESQINGVIVVSKTGEITVSNESAAKILEIKKENVVGKSFKEADYWQQIDQDNNPISAENLPLAIALRAQKAVRNYEHGIQLPDGTTKWLNVSASPILDPEGKLFGAVASFIDVTEQHTVRQKMVRQLERLRLQDKAISSSMSGVIIADARLPDNPVTYVNDAFTHITGYEPHEVIGRNCRFLQGPDKDQEQLDKLRYALKNKQAGEFGLRNYRKDGSLFHSNLILAPVKDEADLVTHFVGIQTDITEKFTAEKALEQARERMQLALAGAQLGLIDINYESGQTYYNDRFGEIVGYTPAELVANFRSWQDLAHPEDLPEAEKKTQEHLVNLTPALEAELRFRHRDGRWIWILCKGRVVERAANGTPLRFTGTILDITERKEQVEKILELSQQLLKISETERSEISSELHDVVGQSLVLLKLNLLKFLRENDLRTAENEKVLLEPIAETLDKVRAISRRLTPSHMQKVGLPLAVEDMLESSQALSGVKFESNLDALDGFFPENWSIPCYRLIQEAVTNALKHSGADRIRISTVRLENNLEITISDNGRGLAEHNDANGIGFSLMRERVRGLRGHMFVNSSGAGVALHILIPAQKR